MMYNFELCIGTTFIFGNDAHTRVGEELTKRSITKVLIHYDGGEYVKPILNSVIASLEREHIAFVELSGVDPNPKLSLVRKGVEIAKEKGVEAILAIGGGSVIDSAKAIGLGAANDGDVWDYFTQLSHPTASLPVAVVLTISASGSESSKVAVITNEEEHRKLLVSLPIIRPALAFMNPALTLSVPRYPTACGIVDMFSHICERYFNVDNDLNVIDYMCEGVLRALVDIGPRCLANLHDYELRAQLMWIATIAQNNTLSIGRDEDWSTHIIANELSACYDVVHGASLAMIMPSWMRVASQRNPLRFARFAQEVFNVLPDYDINDVAQRIVLADKSVIAVENFFSSLNMPTCCAELDIPDSGIEQMIQQIDFYGEDQAIGSIVRLNREDCRQIFQLAMCGRDR